MREMRRKEKAMTEADVKALLVRAEYGFLSTVNEDNTPYTMPMSFAYIEDRIYLHCATEGHRLENISKNQNICFNAVDSVQLMAEKFSTKFKSVVVFGTAQVVENPEEKKKGAIAIIEKYSADYYDEGMNYIDKAFDNMKVLRIDISRMTGKQTV